MEERKRREREGGAGRHKGDSNIRLQDDFTYSYINDKKGKIQRQISRYELIRNQQRGGHTSFESRSDWIILCQHCYTREPYAASQKQSHDLQEEVM